MGAMWRAAIRVRVPSLLPCGGIVGRSGSEQAVCHTIGDDDDDGAGVDLMSSMEYGSVHERARS